MENWPLFVFISIYYGKMYPDTNGNLLRTIHIYEISVYENHLSQEVQAPQLFVRSLVLFSLIYKGIYDFAFFVFPHSYRWILS